jgi:hypothetical protein
MCPKNTYDTTTDQLVRRQLVSQAHILNDISSKATGSTHDPSKVKVDFVEQLAGRHIDIGSVGWTKTDRRRRLGMYEDGNAAQHAYVRTAALWTHDGDDGVGEAAPGDTRGRHEPLRRLARELALAVDQLHRRRCRRRRVGLLHRSVRPSRARERGGNAVVVVPIEAIAIQLSGHSPSAEHDAREQTPLFYIYPYRTLTHNSFKFPT